MAQAMQATSGGRALTSDPCEDVLLRFSRGHIVTDISGEFSSI